MNDLRTCEAVVSELDRRQGLLAASLAETGETLAALEQRLGDDFLDANGENTMRALMEARGRFDMLNAAVAALERRRAAAVVDVDRARVADLRNQAQQKVAELGKLETATKKFLAHLSELEGIPLTASVLSSQPIPGEWLASFRPDPLEWLGVSELTMNIPSPEGKLFIPKSRRLRMDIDELELKAQQLERKLPALQEAAAL